jgi:hypothetical protein
VDSTLAWILVPLGVAIFVWLKIVRPARADRASARQTKRLQHVKFGRLARERRKAESGDLRP